MPNDEIIDELRAIRRGLALEAGNDLHRICENAREWERLHPERIANSIELKVIADRVREDTTYNSAVDNRDVAKGIPP